MARTVLGQTAELKWMKDNKLNFTEHDWFFIADGKTGYYTIACPMRLGAIIAGACKSQLDRLAEYGLVLGKCFQLADDILDVTSDKSNSTDKQTLKKILQKRATKRLMPKSTEWLPT